MGSTTKSFERLFPFSTVWRPKLRYEIRGIFGMGKWRDGGWKLPRQRVFGVLREQRRSWRHEWRHPQRNFERRTPPLILPPVLRLLKLFGPS